MRKTTLTLTLFLLCLLSKSQKNGLINSAELLQESGKLNEAGKHKEALKVLSEISRSDTNYHTALYEKAYTCYVDSSYENCIRFAEDGLIRFPSQAPDWYNILANAYDELGNHEKALSLYDSMLLKFKNNPQGWFNKGITLYKMKNLVDAKKFFQQCILVNPYYSSAHYFLGVIATEEGRLPEAMMSFATYLVLNPDGRYHTNIIKAFTGVAKMTDETIASASKRKASKLDDFDLLQEILVSKISLDKQYKLKSSVEDPIVRQLQVLCEKLEYNKNDKGFWMQYYVPFFSTLLKEEKFDAFSNYIFSGLDIKSIQSWLSKNKSKLGDFKNSADNYFKDIRATQTLNYTNRDTVTAKYFYENYLIGKGATRNKEKELQLVGYWELYYPNGYIKSRGVYSNDQELEGTWEYFYNDGQIKERSHFVNGKLEGKCDHWFDNGILSSTGNYKEGEQDGDWKYYYYNGLPNRSLHFVKGLTNGKAIGYTSTADLLYHANYKNDTLQAETKYYHKNGKPETSTMYVDGKADGPYKKYYLDGSIQEQGEFKNDQRNGKWIQYYENGKVSSESNYVDGVFEGEQKTFFENGKLQNLSTYKNGKVEGKESGYDNDGILFCETIYEKGRLRDIKFFDKTGKVISKSTSRNGSGNLVFYDALGNKTSEGYFTKEGLREGKTTYYYPDLTPSLTSTYKNGMLNGMRTDFHSNGKKSFEGNFTDDVPDGYQQWYYSNGQTSSEGWIINDKKQGEHLTFNNLGNLTSKVNYLNNEENGYTTFYHPNGKLDCEERFEEGWIREFVQYDTAGNILSSFKMPQGNVDFTFKLYNGKPYLFASYRNNKLHGLYKRLYPNDAVETVQYYRWGSMDSVYRSYYPDGKLAAEGNYLHGNKHGVWKFYHPNGNLSETEIFTHGVQNDSLVMFNEDGTIDKKIFYKNDEVNGDYEIFGERNQLAIQLTFKNGKIISYCYEGKDGKLVPEIMLKKGNDMLVSYYKNGNKSAEIACVDGDFEGSRKLFYTNKQLYVDGTKHEGYDNDLRKTFYTDGQLKKEEHYYYGELHGVVKSYYPDGKPLSVENYYLGELNGECKYYDPKGKVQVRVYYFGVMQSIK
jgi:uncharacterized protein